MPWHLVEQLVGNTGSIPPSFAFFAGRPQVIHKKPRAALHHPGNSVTVTRGTGAKARVGVLLTLRDRARRINDSSVGGFRQSTTRSGGHVAKRPDSFYRDAVKVLRHGWVVDPETGERMGKFADGFEARDGFNLREIEDWTPAMKREVTRYFNMVDDLSSRPFQVHRARSPENIRAAQEYAQHQTFPEKLKVAFIPVARPGEVADVKIDRRTKEVTVTERDVDARIMTWKKAGLEPEDIAEDPRGAIHQVDDMMEGKLYTILTGEHELKKEAMPPDQVIREIRRLQKKYGTEAGFNERDPNSSHWKNWLFGVKAYDFPRVRDLQSHRGAKASAQETLQAQRRRDREAWRREHGPQARKKKPRR